MEKIFSSQRLVFLFSCGKRAESNWVWTIQEMLKEHELWIITAPLHSECCCIPGWTEAHGWTGCYLRCDEESRTASGKRHEMEQLLDQEREESCLLLPWSLGQAEQHCCMTQPCVPNEPRLHETPWLQVVSGQRTCPPDTKEISSAVSCL